MNEQELKSVIASVLGLEPSDIDDETSTDAVAAWDSLSHMSLIVAIEQHFHVEFSEMDIIEMVTYPLVRTILAERLQGRAS
jgi:acyl carrier protein